LESIEKNKIISGTYLDNKVTTLHEGLILRLLSFGKQLIIREKGGLYENKYKKTEKKYLPIIKKTSVYRSILDTG
jgi:hypothetical protein